MATIPLGLYLWKRIREIGIESVMGVPGDFNLNFLDFIYDIPGLSWVGNSNELNAAYAADGYARIKGVPGCLVTTHGVGELSALNGIAGSASEHVPIIHIVGQTPRKMQDDHLMIHHSIGTKPDHQIYNKTAERLRCAAAELWDVEKAPAEIDRVLRECFIQKLPVYILFPIDLTLEKVPASLLDKPIDMSLPRNSANEEKAIKAITERLTAAKNPSILVDFLVRSHGKEETRKLVDVLEIPFYASQMAKAIVDEDHPRFCGLYNGQVSFPGITAAIKECDFVLSLGWWPADTNSGGLSREIPAEKRIDIMDNYVIIDGNTLDGVYMAPLLAKLAESVGSVDVSHVKMPKIPAPQIFEEKSAEKISQTYIWRRIGKFLRPGDVCIADTGTAALGLPDATFPKDITYINQTYYGSIGYATPAALGSDLALRELHAASPSTQRRRTVLVTGDGSLQLTINEIGTMVTRGAQPLVIIINNAGYTIERAIHGARAQYNDINTHRYEHLLALYGAEDPKGQFRVARTKEEVEKALAEEAVREPGCVQVLEVTMDMLDIPWRLKQAVERRPGMVGYYEKEGFECVEP